MTYSEKIADHFSHPRNVGTLDNNKRNVGTGLAGAPECGDVIRLQFEMDETKGIICDAKFKTYGSGSTIAASSLVTELLKGRSLDEALKISYKFIIGALDLPLVKLHCAMLVEDAIKAAVNDYQKKQDIHNLHSIES